MSRYSTIVADPPWAYDEGFARGPSAAYGPTSQGHALPYPSMTVEEICDLPVRDLISPTGAALFLWTTNRYLADAFDVMAAWGFRYRQLLVWHKGDASPLGGSVAPNSAEYLLMGRRGGLRLIGRWPTSVVLANRAEHSRKPDVFGDLVETVSPPPYLELFARRQRLGWDTWGNEALEHVRLNPALAPVGDPGTEGC